MKIDISKNVEEILDKLTLNNYEAYVVGGCVRDSLLNKIPKGWDIITNATPIEIQQVFKDYKIIETELKHGTLTILLNGENFEVTTYKTDGKRPDEVKFVKALKEDLLRRDFTINALAYNPKVGLVDFLMELKIYKINELKL